jgi:hypothetical protein
MCVCMCEDGDDVPVIFSVFFLSLWNARFKFKLYKKKKITRRVLFIKHNGAWARWDAHEQTAGFTRFPTFSRMTVIYTRNNTYIYIYIYIYYIPFLRFFFTKCPPSLSFQHLIVK